MIERVGAMFMFGWVFFWLGLGLVLLACATSGILTEGWNNTTTFKDHWTEHAFVKLLKRAAKIMIPFGFIMGTIGFLLPSQKDAAIIVGSGITYNVITSETGKRIGGKAVDLLEQKIDDALKSKTEDKPKEQPKVEGKST
jgi:hypothetical protein